MGELTSEDRVWIMKMSIYNTISKPTFGGDAPGIYQELFSEEIEEELWDS